MRHYAPASLRVDTVYSRLPILVVVHNDGARRGALNLLSPRVMLRDPAGQRGDVDLAVGRDGAAPSFQRGIERQDGATDGQNHRQHGDHQPQK